MPRVYIQPTSLRETGQPYQSKCISRVEISPKTNRKSHFSTPYLPGMLEGVHLPVQASVPLILVFCFPRMLAYHVAFLDYIQLSRFPTLSPDPYLVLLKSLSCYQKVFSSQYSALPFFSFTKGGPTFMIPYYPSFDPLKLDSSKPHNSNQHHQWLP